MARMARDGCIMDPAELVNNAAWVHEFAALVITDKTHADRVVTWIISECRQAMDNGYARVRLSASAESGQVWVEPIRND